MSVCAKIPDMAKGRSHSIATLSAATCFVVASAIKPDPQLLLAAGGALLGLMVMPDLDVDEGSISQHFVRSTSWIAEKIWWGYWYPYRRLISHRSFWSHFPVVGTAIRVLYLFWWFYLAGFSLPPAFLSGLVAVDAIHWFMDMRLFRRIFTQ